MKRTLTKTADGSYTLYVPELDEHYHSIHGALQEANHVFIKHGLEPIKDRSSIRVLEMGLGTALNAYLSYQWAKKNKLTLWYSGVEAYPVESELITTCLKEIGVCYFDTTKRCMVKGKNWDRFVSGESWNWFTMRTGSREYSTINY
mgnify:CR=1 FL=1